MNDSSGVLASLHEVSGRSHRGHVLTKSISLTLRPAETAALIGPNGAGKTTALLILAGRLAPRVGEARLFDHVPTRLPRSLYARMYAVIEPAQAYDFLTFRQYEAWHQAFYPRWDSEIARNLAESFALPTDRPVARLSRGQRLKAHLTCAFAARPDLMLLDEPFENLDASSREVLTSAIQRRTAYSRGALLLSAHRREDVATFATANFEMN